MQQSKKKTNVTIRFLLHQKRHFFMGQIIRKHCLILIFRHFVARFLLFLSRFRFVFGFGFAFGIFFWIRIRIAIRMRRHFGTRFGTRIGGIWTRSVTRIRIGMGKRPSLWIWFRIRFRCGRFFAGLSFVFILPSQSAVGGGRMGDVGIRWMLCDVTAILRAFAFGTRTQTFGRTDEVICVINVNSVTSKQCYIKS